MLDACDTSRYVYDCNGRSKKVYRYELAGIRYRIRKSREVHASLVTAGTYRPDRNTSVAELRALIGPA